MFPYQDLYNAKVLGEDYLLNNRSYVMGGMFGVGKEKIDELCGLVEQTFEKLLDDGIVNNEQIHLGYLFKKHPDLFIEFINDLRIHRGYELIVELSNEVMKSLVTGGCGFIGSNLVNRLVDLGHEGLRVQHHDRTQRQLIIFTIYLKSIQSTFTFLKV